jgi:hypothetical protein
VFVVYNRRREAQIKYPNPDDDIRENIINYEDEGGGEDDMTAFDITPLQIPVAADPALGHHSLPRAKMAAAAHCNFLFVLLFQKILLNWNGVKLFESSYCHLGVLNYPEILLLLVH